MRRALGSIHLDIPSLTPVLDNRGIIVKSMKSGIRVKVTSKDTSIVSKGRRVSGWVGMSGVYTL